MKYTLLSWVLLAFTNVLAAVDSGDAKFMVVHDVKVAFDKSRRDIEVITFNVFNVQEGKGFTCTSTKMPYYPMTPDFVSLSFRLGPYSSVLLFSLSIAVTFLKAAHGIILEKKKRLLTRLQLRPRKRVHLCL